MYSTVDPDGQPDPNGDHPHSHSDADPDGLDGMNGDPSGAFGMPSDVDVDGSGRGGRKKRSETTTEDWTRIRKDNHARHPTYSSLMLTTNLSRNIERGRTKTSWCHQRRNQ